VFECVSIFSIKCSLESFSAEAWEKAIKILFHICKQLYKKNLLSSVVALKSCMKHLCRYHMKIRERKSKDIEKLFFMIHQMGYSMFTKEFKNIINKKDCDVTQLFVLRTHCLIILSFSNWQENNLLEHTKDFCTRWMKILCHNTYSYNPPEVYFQISDLMDFIIYILVNSKEECWQRLHELLKKIIELSSRLACLNNENCTLHLQYLQPKITEIKETNTKIDLTDFYLMNDICKTNSEMSFKEKCYCKGKTESYIIPYIDNFVTLKLDVKQFLNYLAWIRHQYQTLKERICLKPLWFFMQLTSKLLSLKYIQKQLLALSTEDLTLTSQTIFHQCLGIIQAVDIFLGNQENFGCKKERM